MNAPSKRDKNHDLDIHGEKCQIENKKREKKRG